MNAVPQMPIPSGVVSQLLLVPQILHAPRFFTDVRILRELKFHIVGVPFLALLMLMS